jgi:hypothetical protein
MMAYDAQKRSQGLALLAEFLLPGLGSIYGDHFAGAAITWGAMIAGFVLLVWGLENSFDSYDSQTDSYRKNDSAAEFGFLAGLLLLLGGRIYGFVDSWQATGAYNERLRQRLGVPAGFSFGLTRFQTPEGMAAGPRLRWTF